MSEVGKHIEAKTKAHAEEVRDQLLELAGEFGGRYWKCGLLAAEVHQSKIWEILGLVSESAFRESIKIGRSTYFRCRRLATEIAQPLLKKELVTRARLNRLTLENAEQLLRLDERRRFAAAWVEKAITMKEAEFEIEVDHCMLNDDDVDLGKPEAQAVLKIHMTAGQKNVIEATFRDFARAQDPPLEIDDYSHILEFLCAEWNNSQGPEPMPVNGEAVVA